MKLYKNYHHFQILHLYEHVLVATLFKQLRHLNRWEYLDFYFNAQTFSTGLLLIEFTKYRRFKLDFKQLKLDLSDQAISQAKQLIFTEKQIEPITFDNHKIRQELHQIHHLPWHKATDFNLENVNDSPNFHLNSQTRESKIINFKQDYSNIIKSQRPIAQQFIGFFNVNFATFLAQQAGFYPVETIDQTTVVIEKFLAPQQAHNLNHLLKNFCQDFINDDNLNTFYKELIQADSSINLPDFQQLIAKIAMSFDY